MDENPIFLIEISIFFSSFLPVNRTKNLVIFFSQIFKGFTLVPWQKVGRIGLGFIHLPYCIGKKLVEFALISLWNLFSSSLPSNERSIWHRLPISFFSSFHKFSPNWQKKVGISGICWDISEILTDSESAFKTGSFEHLKTIVAWMIRYPDFISTHSIFKTFKFLIW